ncbi:MAG: TlpA family protein disulfide reductase [Candidatus Sericytochromatia bacterium]|nr:TlpA family protein disulfide reductase [Candidatus Tanganyikabacteria bacterium]
MKRVLVPLALIGAALAAPAGTARAAAEVKAPDFALKDLQGKTVKLSQFKGKVVMVNFWATWCPPCIHEMPSLESLYNANKKKGFVVLGISLDDEPQKEVPQFLAKFKKDKGVKITYPLLVGDEKVGDSYGGIRGIPTTFLVDRKGNIAKKYIGPPSRDAEGIEKAFGEAVDKLL